MVFAGVSALLVRQAAVIGGRSNPRSISASLLGQDVIPASQRSSWDRIGLAVPCTALGQHRCKVVEELLRDRVFGGRGGPHPRTSQPPDCLLADGQLRPCEVGQFPPRMPPRL